MSLWFRAGGVIWIGGVLAAGMVLAAESSPRVLGWQPDATRPERNVGSCSSAS